MTPAFDGQIVIIGAGQAGLQAAHALRKHGATGPIHLLGEEPFAPYQRPPLSKAYLKGDLARDRLFLRPEKFFTDQEISLWTSCTVTAIDRAAGHVRLEGEETLSYDRLILATGAAPRPLPVPGADLDGVVMLRGLGDADALASRLARAERIVVIGGGYIGLEAAATARSLGLDVTVIERLPRLLARVTAPFVSDFFHQLHEDKGVRILCDTGTQAILGAHDGTVTCVTLSSGETLKADLVLVGIGVLPNDALAAEAGLACDTGIVTDRHGQTADPAVYAIGDCSRHPVDGYDGLVRLESVHNAMDQAEKAAAHICGDAYAPGETPWFWSDQYEIKLQTVGLFNAYTDIVIRGDVAARKFAVFYYERDRLIAVDAIGDAAQFMAAKQIFKLGIPLTPVQVADPGLDLKALIKTFKSREKSI